MSTEWSCKSRDHREETSKDCEGHCRESEQLFRPLHTKNEAVPGSGNSMCESQGGACERLECGEDPWRQKQLSLVKVLLYACAEVA